jgi:hypothetical protein
VKTPEIKKTIPSPILNLKEKPNKYSTPLDAALIKKIKLMAAEKESKEYEVIELALTEYFNRQSKDAATKFGCPHTY